MVDKQVSLKFNGVLNDLFDSGLYSRAGEIILKGKKENSTLSLICC